VITIDALLSRLGGVSKKRQGFVARCPAHEDREPSLGITLGEDGRILLHCRAGCTVESVCAAIGIELRDLFSKHGDSQAARTPSFGPHLAGEVWRIARCRARDDDKVEDDAEVYEFLNRRGIGLSWESGSYGILPTDRRLPDRLSGWPASGHRLIVPLYDGNGTIANVQARTVRTAKPKVLFPAGSQARGVLFANEAGRAVIDGTAPTARPVILGEGLTDFLAFTIVTVAPVLCAPGTSTAPSAIGPWVRGRVLLVALDHDDAGQRASREVASRAYSLGAKVVRRLHWPAGCVDACDALLKLGATRLMDSIEAALAMEAA
jgi:Toprim-like